MTQQKSKQDQDYENMHHIARKRKAQVKTVEMRNTRDKAKLITDDEDELDYDPMEYARYIR